VPSGVDPLGLVDGAMVHPNNDVLLRRTTWINRHRRPVRIAQNQRTGRVKANAAHMAKPCHLRQSLTYAKTNSAPNIVAGLLNEIGARTPDTYRVAGLRQHRPAEIKHAGARAAGSDIDADNDIRHAGRTPQKATSMPSAAANAALACIARSASSAEWA
jgi:hypothetical protein